MAAAETKLKVGGGGSDIGDEQLRLWLSAYILDHPHLTTAELSRSDHIGMSKTAWTHI